MNQATKGLTVLIGCLSIGILIGLLIGHSVFTKEKIEVVQPRMERIKVIAEDGDSFHTYRLLLDTRTNDTLLQVGQSGIIRLFKTPKGIGSAYKK